MPIECPAEPDGTLAVEVCIARPRAALRLALRLPAGATVGDALRRAAHDPALDAPTIALLESAAGAARSQAAVDPIGNTTRESGRGESGQGLHAPAASRAAAGVFGKVRLPDWPLRDGDRVEVYRPLVVDPKVARQRRARQRAPGRSGSGALSRSG